MNREKFRRGRIRRRDRTYEWVLQFPPHCWRFWNVCCVVDDYGRVRVGHQTFESAVAQMNRAIIKGLQ